MYIFIFINKLLVFIKTRIYDTAAKVFDTDVPHTSSPAYTILVSLQAVYACLPAYDLSLPFGRSEFFYALPIFQLFFYTGS